MPAKNDSSKLLPKDLYGLTLADIMRDRSERSLGMVPISDPILTKKSKAVEPDELGSSAIQALIENLYRVAHGQRGVRDGQERRTLVGLAAPQIGESYRVVLVDTEVKPDRRQYGKLECMINPEIIWRSKETAEGREGCFSAGVVWGLVRRSIAVKVRYLTANGEVVERIFEDFTARIAQHEIDHLDGLRFADRIRSDRKRHWVHAEEIDFYPKLIKRWPRICSRERWEKLKTIPIQ